MKEKNQVKDTQNYATLRIDIPILKKTYIPIPDQKDVIQGLLIEYGHGCACIHTTPASSVYFIEFKTENISEVGQGVYYHIITHGHKPIPMIDIHPTPLEEALACKTLRAARVLPEKGSVKKQIFNVVFITINVMRGNFSTNSTPFRHMTNLF